MVVTPPGSESTKPHIPDRSSFSSSDTVRYIWANLGLPEDALDSLNLTGSGHGYKSSFRIGHLARNAIGLSALSAALVDSLRREGRIKQVTVPLDHACLEFCSERLCKVECGERLQSKRSDWPSLDAVGGLHKTSDGYVRVHDAFPNHRDGTLKLLGLRKMATREDVGQQIIKWKALELEQAAHDNKLAIYALRSYDEWDALPQARALSDCPISITQISRGDEMPGLPPHMLRSSDRCLRGLRVLELSRVIAAPVAGRTLAAHGADVLWVTSPNLPDLPSLDKDTARGKRTIQLKLEEEHGRETLRQLVKECDVFLQSYRPGSLEAKGFGPSELALLNPNIIYATLSAFGPHGPWSDRRGFDSLVQTCSGMNVSEATFFDNPDGKVAQPAPCQPLDHGSGQFLAAGIATAVYKRALYGGSWHVEVSLAATMKYLRSLGQVNCGPDGFEGLVSLDGTGLEDHFEVQESGFGRLRALKHAAVVEGAMPGFEHMPKPLGSDEPAWPHA